MVYLRHLSYLSSVDGWNNFKPEDIRDIVVDLRKWVMNTKTRMNQERNKKQLNPYPYENIRIKNQWSFQAEDLSSFPSNIDLYPVEIYKRVGVPIYDEMPWEESK